jgi:ATP-binding cassette subfamily B protein IrtA
MMGIFKFLKSIHVDRTKLFLLLPMIFLISFLTLAQPEVLRRATAAIMAKNMDELISALIIATIAAVLFIVISFFKEVYLRKTQNYYEKELGNRLVNKLTHTKMNKLSKKGFGDVSTSIIRNSELFVSSIVNTVSNGSSGYFSLILTFAYMCLIQWQLALCILVYNIVIRFFAVFVERKIKKNTVEASDAMKESGNNLSALLRNMMTVRIYSNKDFFISKVKAKEKAVMNTAWRSFVWSNGFQDFIWAFSKLAEFVIVYGVGAILISTGYSDMSILMTFIFTNDLFTIGINSISQYIQSKSEYEAYKDSVMEILGETELEQEPENNFSNFNGEIIFENVSFSYNDKAILNSASFKINSGEKVLLEGDNGEGKSTILKLICGLYRPQSGKIYYNGTDICGINITSISKKCNYISQHSHLLEGNIQQNIVLSNHFDETDVNDILQKLNLEDCINTSPQNLSMGEQQRLNIGRAIYKSSGKILLCDEIFSNIDKDNRQAVMSALLECYKDSTVIMISHEQVMCKFDRILHVGNGKVTEVKL